MHVEYPRENQRQHFITIREASTTTANPVEFVEMPKVLILTAQVHQSIKLKLALPQTEEQSEFKNVVHLDFICLLTYRQRESVDKVYYKLNEIL